jgi:hypothetical protein
MLRDSELLAVVIGLAGMERRFRHNHSWRVM